MAFSSENAGFSLGQLIRRNRTALIVGGLIGLMSGGLVGLLFGAGIGVALSAALKNALGNVLNPQDAFFRATFTVMGKLAKADGRVSEEEIRYAREVMDRMGLSDARRREAMALFSQGKESDFDIAEVMRPLSAPLCAASVVSGIRPVTSSS